MARTGNKRRKRHAVDIYRDPTGAYGASGERVGQPQLIKEKVFCSIESLRGTELDQARSTFSMAVYQVELFGDPAWGLDDKCFLKFGNRRLYVGWVDNVEQKGFEYHLLCGESPWEVPSGSNG